MPKIVLPLTNAKIQAAKPAEKMYKLADYFFELPEKTISSQLNEPFKITVL